ncbi:MAG: SMC family ATPase [Candidatus Atribacteria bacterium]|nr:SMC family ATPase [Candidatus Atribacteria bacterium]
MVPVKLTLKNFLSYGEDVPPLDFEQFHIACLSGNNGQGKSALLDAITWAIWGEGRKSSREKKADSSLLRMGQKDMQVEFVFDLEADRYRIIRTFSLEKKNSRSGLEFQVFNQQSEQYISLTATSIRKTQEKITGVLKIDYQTFINSAFILQGRIDEFSKKNARERKEILSEILNLSHYDKLSNLARLHLKEINHLIISLDSRLNVISDELVKSNLYQEKIKTLSGDYQKIQAKITKKEEEISGIKERLHVLKLKNEQFMELEIRNKQIQQEAVQEKKEITLKSEELRFCEEMISQKNVILLKHKNYQAFSKERNELVRKLQKIRKMEAEKMFIEKKIERKKADLTISLRNKEDRYLDLQRMVKESGKYKIELLDLESKMQKIGHAEERKEKIREQGMNLKLELGKIKDRQKRLEKTIEDDREKLRLLRENPKGECPLCESELNADKKKKIEKNIEQEIAQHQKEIDQLIKEEREKNNQKDQLTVLWREIENKIKDKVNYQQALSNTRVRYQQAEQAGNAAKRIIEEIKTIQGTIKKGKYAQAEQKELNQVIGIIKDMGYHEKKHNELDEKIEALQNAPLRYAKLEDAEKKINIIREALGKLKNKSLQKETDVKNIERKIGEIREKVKNIPDLKEIIFREEKQLKFYRGESNQLLEEKGGYQSKFDHCQKLKKEKKGIEGDLKKRKKEQGIYEKLIVAFGKNGIQALIIENVLPEIEEEANDILAKLTNNRTQISIESLRDLKSGESRETLDIKISDELGNRDYELYSGGESFRIDFALRIALSKLLTRRAGAKLRTLVMDEGFGTQDEEGIDNLIQAIEAISNDFDKILIITHLESLKTAFPTNIEVTKLPEIGSRYKVINN